MKHWLCVTCGFALPAVKWRIHRRRCLKVRDGAQCVVCRDFVPCRKRGCPHLEKPEEVDPTQAPTPAVVRSLQMKVKRLDDGRWTVRAPWLDGPVIKATWPEAYWEAVRLKRCGAT